MEELQWIIIVIQLLVLISARRQIIQLWDRVEELEYLLQRREDL